MKSLSSLGILPPPEKRFGFARTCALVITAGTALLASNIAHSHGAKLLAIVLLIGSVLTPLLWNRRARKLGAPGFFQAPHPSIRRLGFAMVAIVTLLALGSAIEYWRAANLWKSVRDDIRKRGEPLTFSELIGPPVAAEQDFAQTPLLADLFTFQQTTDGKGKPVFRWTGVSAQRVLNDLFDLPPVPKAKSGKKTTKHTGADLESLAASFRSTNSLTKAAGVDDDDQFIRAAGAFPRPSENLAPANAVLFALEARKDAMAEIAEAARRPHARFALRYEEGAMTLLPHLAIYKSMAIMFRARATARLALGDTAGAAEDIETIFHLGDKLSEENTLIGYLIRIAIDAIGYSAFWSGTITHSWTEPQLAAFQARFESMEYASGLIRGFRGERLLGAATMENLINNRQSMGQIFNEGGDNPLMFLMPSFWLRQNQARHSKVLDRAVEVLQGARADRTLSSQHLPDVFADFLKSSGNNPYNIIVRMLIPAFHSVSDKTDRALAATRLAVCVCALERHRIKTGVYPSDLAALTPRYLKETPVDPASGQPLRYSLEPDGSFTLYSVGLNQKDDGAPGDGTGVKNGQMVDWVWPPAKPTEEIRLF